jgi:RNA polymerase sigma-70 factor (ECF subfamily)
MIFWRRTAFDTHSKQERRLAAFSSTLDHAREGEAEAISVLYRHFLSGIFWYIAARVPDRATAEDLTSEVFLAMVEGIQKVRATNEAAFASWLFQIARITVAGYYRKRERLPASVSLESTSSEDEQTTTPILVSSPDADPVQWTEAREEWSTVTQAINALTEEQRQVLVGRLILGYDVATVAQMVGKQVNAVKALQFRALKSLERLLRKQSHAEEDEA